jgi:hypothetical protein
MLHANRTKRILLLSGMGSNPGISSEPLIALLHRKSPGISTKP